MWYSLPSRAQHRVIGQRQDFAAGQHAPHRAGHRVARLGVDDAEDVTQRLSTGLFERPARQPLGDGVHARHAAFQIGGDHRVADRLQRDRQALLAGAQDLLGALALGDVDHSADRAHLVALTARAAEERLRACRQEAHLAIAADDPVLDIEQPVAGGIVGALYRRIDVLEVRGEHVLQVDLQRDLFVGADAVDRALFRRPMDNVVGVVVVEDADARHTRGLHQALLAQALRLAGRARERDVACDAQHAGQMALRVAHRRLDRLEQPAVAVARKGHPFLVDGRLARRHRLTVVLAKRVGDLLGHEVVVGLADDGVAAAPVQALHRRVALQVHAVDVLEKQQVGHRFQRGTQAILGRQQAPMRPLDRLDENGAVQEQVGHHLVQVTHQVVDIGHAGIQREEEFAQRHRADGDEQRGTVERLRRSHAQPQGCRAGQVQRNQHVFRIDLERRQSPSGDEGPRRDLGVEQEQPVRERGGNQHTAQDPVARRRAGKGPPRRGHRSQQRQCRQRARGEPEVDRLLRAAGCHVHRHAGERQRVREVEQGNTEKRARQHNDVARQLPAVGIPADGEHQRGDDDGNRLEKRVQRLVARNPGDSRHGRQ